MLVDGGGICNNAIRRAPGAYTLARGAALAIGAALYRPFVARYGVLQPDVYAPPPAISYCRLLAGGARCGGGVTQPGAKTTGVDIACRGNVRMCNGGAAPF